MELYSYSKSPENVHEPILMVLYTVTVNVHIPTTKVNTLRMSIGTDTHYQSEHVMDEYRYIYPLPK